VDKAIESYLKAIEIDTKDWLARAKLGVAYMQKHATAERE